MFTAHKPSVVSIVSAVVMCVGGLGCSGSSSPSSPTPTRTTSYELKNVQVTNGAPVINSVNGTPAWGITLLHEHTFTSDASDPDDDTLTYRWEDSAGELLSEAASFTHMFDNLAETETKEITLTVQDADGLSTSSSVTVTSISLTGTWVSNRGFPSQGSKLMTFVLTQSVVGDTSTGHFQPRPHIRDFECCRLTGTGDWASNVFDLGPEGEPGTVTADGSVRIRAKWLNNKDTNDDGFILQSIDGGTGSFDFTPAQGVTMTGEVNGSGVNDYLLTFTQQ